METSGASSFGDGPAPFPLFPTPLIGREQIVAEVAGLLRGNARLVTLSGPGGVGKTRLAAAAASEVLEIHTDGAWFVELAPIADAGLVGPTIARHLGVRDDASRPVGDLLAGHIRDTRTLLVLDNFEHVVEAAPLVAELLTSCSRLAVLTTSRVPLQIRGEQVFPVPPLALPEPAQSGATETISKSSAVRLFVSQARAADPAFALDAGNAPAVAEICRRLDGLPLAIELAAARTRILPPAALLARLERRLPLLISGSRDAPARHQTLRATIAWSYDLLTPEEQALFRRLAVFAGGFTLEAAQAVDEDDSLAVLDRVSALVDRNLVTRGPEMDAEPRFEMLETIREFAIDRLSGSSEENEVRRAHASWVLEFVRTAHDRLDGPDRAIVHRQVATELDNVRGALAWAIRSGEAETAQALAGYLSPFWMDMGLVQEGRRWLDQALSLPGASIPSRVLALYWAGFDALWGHDPERAAAVAEEALTLAEPAGYRFGMALAHNLKGALAELRSDLDSAEAHYTAALSHLDGLTEPPPAPAYRGLVLTALGTVEELRGNLEEAAARYEAALAIYRGMGSLWGVPLCLEHLATVALRQGAASRALALHQECLAHRWEISDRFDVPWNLLGIAETLAESGLHIEAARLLGAADAMFIANGYSVSPRERDRIAQASDTARAGVKDTAFAAAWADGAAMSMEDAVALALATTLETATTTDADRAGRFGLSPRELQVLRLIAEGQTNQEIADALFISRRTATSHASSILQKLNLRSRGEAIAFAHRERLT